MGALAQAGDSMQFHYALAIDADDWKDSLPRHECETLTTLRDLLNVCLLINDFVYLEDRQWPAMTSELRIYFFFPCRLRNSLSSSLVVRVLPSPASMDLIPSAIFSRNSCHAATRSIIS